MTRLFGFIKFGQISTVACLRSECRGCYRACLCYNVQRYGYTQLSLIELMVADTRRLEVPRPVYCEVGVKSGPSAAAVLMADDDLRVHSFDMCVNSYCLPNAQLISARHLLCGLSWRGAYLPTHVREGCSASACRGLISQANHTHLSPKVRWPTPHSWSNGRHSPTATCGNV